MNLAAGPAVRLWLQPLWHRWRWPGVIGVVCLAVAAWVHAMVLPEMREQWSRAGDELAQAERQAERRRQAGTTAAPLAPSQRFRATFPPSGERHDRLAALVSLAALHGMPSPRIDLRWLTGEPLARYEITMSVVAGYADLRAFLSAALVSDPASSLDALQLRRVDVSAPQVEAELRWSLYLRDDVAAGAAASPAMRSADGIASASVNTTARLP